ncbi:MAG TPA: efflux RND transporter periplasmic adaptor subunit [Burkholderiaceae bacterium]
MLMNSLARSAIFASLLLATMAIAAASDLPTTPVRAGDGFEANSFDGVVEAVRNTAIAAQVPGAIVELKVKAGDKVVEGQVLLRIDARSAQQTSAASQAQVLAARSSLDVAKKEFERQKHLFEKEYISQAALERAEAQYQATSAQLSAQIAEASAAHIQTDFFIVKAPYKGVVSEVSVSLGDMAMPGRPLVTIYDPSAMRVSAPIPQNAVSGISLAQPISVEFPSLPQAQRRMELSNGQILPTVDSATHAMQLRLSLPSSFDAAVPGTFARVWLNTKAGITTRLYVPSASIVRRAEVTGLYVVDESGHALLRQVRLGAARGDMTEVLSGVSLGEHVAIDPQVAAKDKR